MRDLLEFVVKNVVDKPEEVKIETSTQEGEEVYSLNVAPEDMGKVIGKNGQIVRAIRTLLRTKAIKDSKRVRLVLQDTPESL